VAIRGFTNVDFPVNEHRRLPHTFPLGQFELFVTSGLLGELELPEAGWRRRLIFGSNPTCGANP
jgi:hypothetical protein